MQDYVPIVMMTKQLPYQHYHPLFHYPACWWSGDLNTESTNRWKQLRRWALFGTCMC